MVMEDLHRALRLDRRIRVVYRSADMLRFRSCVVDPLGLFGRGAGYYLVGTSPGWDGPVNFSVDRIAHTSVTDERCERLNGFDLRRYLEEPCSFRLNTDCLRLELRVAPWLLPELRQRPLGKQQDLAPIADEEDTLLHAHVSDTQSLRQRIRALGVDAQVIHPRWLREELADEFLKLATHYSR